MSRAPVQPVADGSRPRWSVMIPTYHCARYLETTLNSVLAQDPGREVMQVEVVDDNSTADDPEEVVARVGRGRIDFHRQPENLGVVGNLNTCLRRSRGQFVHLLHGDDFVLEGFYGTMDGHLRNHPDVGAAYCRHVYVDEHGRWLGIAPLDPRSSGVIEDGSFFFAMEQRIMTPCITVRRSVYEQVGGFDDRLAYTEDWEMWVRVTRRFSVYYEEKPLACYRMHDASSTVRNLRGGRSLDDTRLAIEILGENFEPSDRSAIRRIASSRYAASGLETARRLRLQGDTATARAQLPAVWRLDKSLRTAIGIAQVALRSLGRPRSGASGQE